jgi:hypothetical protein
MREGQAEAEFVVVDSLDALSDRSEMDRDIDEGSYGANKAKKMSEMFRRLTQTMSDKNVTLLIVSQVRDKIGAMFGAKHTRTGRPGDGLLCVAGVDARTPWAHRENDPRLETCDRRENLSQAVTRTRSACRSARPSSRSTSGTALTTRSP